MNVFSKIKSFFYSTDNTSSVNESSAFLSGLSDNRPIYIAPRFAYYLEDRSGDLGKIVNDISRSISELRKGVRNREEGGEIDFSHPIIDFLNNPGGGLTGTQFWFHIAESFLLTEEIYLVARGNPSREPLELVFIRPYDITIYLSESFGEPITIQTNSRKDRNVYTREVIDGKTRYFDKQGLNELIPIRGSISITDEWRGRSPLVRLYYDVAMNTDGKRHNVSMLQNGMRNTGVLSPKGTKDGLSTEKWNQDFVNKLEKHIRAFNQGAGNAGNVLVIGKSLELQGLNQNNKDMDFMNLLLNSRDSIYNLYSYPLALVSTESMTLDNLKVANRTYYTKAVFPKFNQIADGLINALAERFGMTQDEIITFSDVAIRDLQSVLIDNMVALKETEAVSTNEIRSVGGFESLGTEGDSVLVSMNKTTLDSVGLGPEFPPIENEEGEEELDGLGDQANDESEQG